MVARARHMWHAILYQAPVRESCESRTDTADLDDMLDDDEEVEEVYPKTSKLPGMMNTPKLVFMS